MKVTTIMDGFGDDVQYEITGSVSGGSRATHDSPGEGPDVEVTAIVRVEGQKPGGAKESRIPVEVNLFERIVGERAMKEIEERLLDAAEDQSESDREDADYARAEAAAERDYDDEYEIDHSFCHAEARRLEERLETTAACEMKRQAERDVAKAEAMRLGERVLMLEMDLSAYKKSTERLMDEAKAAADDKDELLRKMRNQNNIISELKRSEAKLREALKTLAPNRVNGEVCWCSGDEAEEPGEHDPACKRAREAMAGEIHGE